MLLDKGIGCGIQQLLYNFIPIHERQYHVIGQNPDAALLGEGVKQTALLHTREWPLRGFSVRSKRGFTGRLRPFFQNTRLKRAPVYDDLAL